VDLAEIEKLIAIDKKRPRDWHKPALPCGGNYEENSLENKNVSVEENAGRNISLSFAKVFKNLLECNEMIRKDLLHSDDNAASDINNCVNSTRGDKRRRATNPEEEVCLEIHTKQRRIFLTLLHARIHLFQNC